MRRCETRGAQSSITEDLSLLRCYAVSLNGSVNWIRDSVYSNWTADFLSTLFRVGAAVHSTC